LVLAAAAPVLVLIGWEGSVWTIGHLFWIDLALGPAIACLLAALATGRPAPLLRALEARPIHNLGLSSYSLYLTHAPIVALVYEKIVAGRVHQGVPAFLVTLVLVLPLTIGFARMFAAVFEAPFVQRRASSGAPVWRLPRDELARIGRAVWAWGRVVGPAAVLAVLVWRLGTGPFVAGVRSVDGRALAAAAGIGALTTVCCAWRWRIVARGLGVNLPLSAAVAAYYRSQFLNVTLPGGIVGDVHRGVSHGREISDVGRALRAVAWERFAGQIVQGVLTVVLLLVLPSPAQSSMPVVAIAVIAMAAVGIVLVAKARPDGGRSAWARARSAVAGDIRNGLLARRAWLSIALASALVVAGHAATFLIAARTAGTVAAPSQMLPIALLVMLAIVLPSAGGWGPREGVTAWAFGAAGLGAQRGVATAVVYGVMVLVATLPGAAVLVVAWFRNTRLPRRRQLQLREGTAHV
jgi:uncharacterized membrane protein YbhN (UPF0104 family)